MKSFISSIFRLLLVVLIGCRTEKKQEIVQEISILEKVANAHGFKNWNKIDQIHFTFNVDRDSTHFERSWIWKPKVNEITRISGADSLTYTRKTMDSIAYKTNAGFINDRYWLLAPFNLMWDKNNFKFTHEENISSPIAKKPMHKLTIVYGNEGGYTPGDAYDFYFEEDYLIKEWIFRKGNQPEPSMTTTWENYDNTDDIIFAIDHKKDKEIFNLYFTNVVTTTAK
jgi:hypothetical protein